MPYPKLRTLAEIFSQLYASLQDHLPNAARCPERVRLAGGDFSAGDYKAIISRCDLVVAERMHAAIAGLSTGVPTLLIGYSIKAEGILTDLLGAALTKSAALISIQDFLAPGAGLSRVEAAWHGRAELASALQASLPGMKSKSRQAYEHILRAIASAPAARP